MSTEATQNTGADVIDLENLFAEDGADNGNPDGTDGQGASDTNGQEVQVEIDPETGEPIQSADATGDELNLELEVDPNNPDGTQAEVLVVPDDHKVTLQIDGAEVEVSYGDLKAGFQMRKASERRFEEAAAIRKEYTEKAQQLPVREQQLGQVLDYYIKASQEFMQAVQPDWAKLIAEDPQKYLVERHNWENRQREMNQAAQVRANLQAQQARDAAASAEQRALEARDNLVKAIPDWADPQKLAAGAQQIDQYLAKSGISVEMRTAIDSAPVLLIARKAMLYDQAIAKQQQARLAGGARGQTQAVAQTQGQRVTQKAQGGRVERPGAARSPAQSAASRQNIDRVNADKRFAANPSVDTLADFFG